MTLSRQISVVLLTSIFILGTAWASEKKVKKMPSIIEYKSIHHPVIAENGMVVSQHYLASRVGREILQKGGNAVDAAVATALALAVVLPRAGNLGGGGFMMVYLAKTEEVLAIDYREVAPLAARRDMYLDKDGNVDNQKARFSHLSAGVPGTVAGLSLALEKYGTMSWEQVITPAIELAEQGFTVSWDLADNLQRRKTRLQSQATQDAFYKSDGSSYQAGELLKQPDLAWSLNQLKKYGKDAFYKGEIAEKIVADMKKNGGLISLKDLADYRPQVRKAVTGSYRGYDIVTMPPSSSGGIHLIQILNILEHFPIQENGSNSAQNIHLMTEAMKLAYADRSEHLGDPDFYKVPIKWLLSKEYAKKLAKKIDPNKARSSSEIKPGIAPKYESPDTTHFSVVDQWGNAVSNTYTLNFSYGSGIVVEGAGFLLNNEMDDFSAKPGTPNGYGLIGGEANAIAAKKRPLSSMTPTFVFKDGQLKLVTGSPGGSRIITTVLQVVMNTIDHGMNVAEATHTARIHHQWLPDTLFYEPSLNKDTLELLKAKGHKLKQTYTMGSTQSIQLDDYIYGSSDPRRPNAEAAGY